MCTCPRAGLKKALLSYFTAKSSFGGRFQAPFRRGCSILENVAHFFHFVGYTLTCLVSGWCGAVGLTVVLSWRWAGDGGM